MDLAAPRPRPSQARCALCHDVAGDGVIACVGCGTLTHEACRREAGGGCPTLGCELRLAAPEAAPARPRRRERGVPTEIVFLSAAFGFFWNASLTDEVDVGLRWGCVVAGAVCVVLASYLVLDTILGRPGWEFVRAIVATPSWAYVRAVLLRVVLPSIVLMVLLGPCTTGEVI